MVPPNIKLASPTLETITSFCNTTFPANSMAAALEAVMFAFKYNVGAVKVKLLVEDHDKLLFRVIDGVLAIETDPEANAVEIVDASEELIVE